MLKKVRIILTALLLLAAVGVNAQVEETPWSIALANLL